MTSFQMKIGKSLKGATYGLNIRKKGKPTLKKPSIFAQAAEEEDDTEHVNQHGYAKLNSYQMKTIKKTYEQALKEDSTVFDYDGVYDTMKEKKEVQHQEKEAKRKEKKSRYVQDLLQQAEFREREQDILWNRKELRERMKEDSKYQGKEKFMTSAYKKKQIEDKKWLEQQKKKEELDAKRSKGMHGFMSNLLANRAGEEAPKEEEPTPVAEDVPPAAESRPPQKRSSHSRSPAPREPSRTRSRSPKPRSDSPPPAAEPTTKKETLTDDERVAREIAELKRVKLQREKERKEREAKEIAALARRSDDKTIMSAKERYLARKRAREQGKQDVVARPEKLDAPSTTSETTPSST